MFESSCELSTEAVQNDLDIIKEKYIQYVSINNSDFNNFILFVQIQLNEIR